MKKDKKTGVFATGITLILLTTIFIIYRSSSKEESSLFAIDDGKEVTRIELFENGKRLILEKKGREWNVNGTGEARKSGIQFIMRVLHELKIKSPVSPELFESEISGKGLVAVKVKVFEKRKLIKTFLVYKTHSNLYGNVMKLKESSKPFIVHVPGYDGDIGSGFTLNELFWQPYTVFNLMPSEISSVDFENMSDTASSFNIEVTGAGYILSDKTGVLEGWDQALVSRYLSYFTWIPLESWVLDIKDQEKLKIESQQPLYRISVKTKMDTTLTLMLLEKNIDRDSLLIRDSDRLYGKKKNQDELFVMRYYDIDPILKKKSYFFHEY